MGGMAQLETKPVEDTVPKVNDEIAVGSDLEFQRSWWKFERIAWIVLLVIIGLDIAGVFGRGPVAKARIQAPDRSYTIKYERIERYSTPSILTIEFTPAAITSGKIQLWADDELLKGLGNERVIPQPESSEIVNGGILYTFPAAAPADSVEFALSPKSPGVCHLKLGVPGHSQVELAIYIVP